ncbi:MAG: hypothetical protein LBS36_10025 [Oscillospiraceae bacterium]|jgi:rubrerythrin|nr:hypothetical protein [Oscillospiraceae bacterium]
MEFSTTDYVKKSLLDTQARIREFMDYSDIVEGDDLRRFFKSYAESEAHHAQEMREWIENKQKKSGQNHFS